MTQTSAPAPWDQYPGESPLDFALFAVFRDLGLARSYAAVVRSVPGYCYSYVCDCARAWGWLERVEAYDQWCVAEREGRLRKLRDEQSERWANDQAILAELTTMLVRNELEALLKLQRDGVRMKEATLARLAELLHRHQQIATGKPTEIVDSRIDLDQLDPENRAALDRLRPELERIARG
jgi:hypothetical protein